jgi:hypothetical protein
VTALRQPERWSWYAKAVTAAIAPIASKAQASTRQSAYRPVLRRALSVCSYPGRASCCGARCCATSAEHRARLAVDIAEPSVGFRRSVLGSRLLRDERCHRCANIVRKFFVYRQLAP